MLRSLKDLENYRATATDGDIGKVVNLLVDDGILYKKRGIGMFVATGSQARLAKKRRDHFESEYVRPLIAEAAKLGLTQAQLVTMIQAAPIHKGDTE